MTEKNTYKYKVLLDGKIIFKGFTYDLNRRTCEHHARWPKCKVEQVGSKVTWEEAQEWAGKRPIPSRRTTMEITKAVAKKALQVFREEQKKRTRGFYTGCFCDGCVECMKLALESVLK